MTDLNKLEDELKKTGDENIFPLIKKINKYDGINTMYCCAGHVNENTPYVVIKLSDEKIDYFINTVKSYDYEKRVAGEYYHSKDELTKENNVFLTKKLEMEVNKENIIAINIRKRPSPEKKKELLKIRNMLNTEIIKLLNKYKYFRNSE